MPTIANRPITQVGKMQRAFDHARSKIKEQMSAKEFKLLVQISSLDHLLEGSQRIANELTSRKPSIAVSKVSKLALGIGRYAPIVEGLCKLVPMGGDLVWGVVSYLLITAASNMNILEEVLEFFTGMAEEIKHLTLVEKTFEEFDMIGPAIEAVYVAIVKFWTKAMEYYMDKMKSDIISRMKTWLTSSSAMFDEFTKLKAKIRAQQTKLHELEASLHHNETKTERLRLRQEKLSDFLSPPDYEHHFRTAKQSHYDGTCEWLREKEAYNDWLMGETSGLLVIRGTAGVGKTVLASWLVDELRSHPTRHVTIYHFFKETDDSCNSALSATRSLLDQVYDVLLSTNHPLLDLFESNLLELLRKKHIHFGTLWPILSSFLSEYTQHPQRKDTFAISIVLDAMDECKDSGELFRSLQKLVYTASNMYVLVTGRPGGYTDGSDAEHAPSWLLEVTQDDVERDIAAVVESSIGRIDRFRDPRLFHFRDRIIAEFSDAKNHQGMFLWAFLMCQEVRRPLSKTQILNLLKNLPKGLNDTYARICVRLFNSNEINPEFSRYVLQWIVASKRPMTFAELEEALKLTPNDNGELLWKDFCDEDGNLLWSRKDVVKCCGDLVRYSGLDQGDTIGIVHLSAQQFLSIHPSVLNRHLSSDAVAAVESFLVDIPSMELKMAVTCLKYILSTSDHSDEYRLSPITLRQTRAPGQNIFKQRYPFFDYATIYWAEYGISAIESKSTVGQLKQLLTSLTEFTHSPVSVIWLEELIRLTYIEFAQHTTRRLIALDKTLPSSNILQWSDQMSKVLLDFSRTLPYYPHTIGLCVSHLESIPADKSMTISLEADPERCWVHYDPHTDYLFSASNSYPPALKRQSLRTGIRSRPMLVPVDDLPENGHGLHFMAARSSASHIALAYVYVGSPNNGNFSHLLICWSLNGSEEGSGVESWAKIVSRQVTLHKFWPARDGLNPVLCNNTIITPRGVFDLQTKEYIDTPGAIHAPHPVHGFRYPLFSADGQRFACARGSTVEVASVHGTLIFQHELSDLQDLRLESFSHSGGKLVICSKEVEPFCIVIDEAKEINLSFPSKYFSLRGVVFTGDERKLVARLDKKLAVWTFLQEEDGSYHDYADMIYVFEAYDLGFRFDLAQETSDEIALVAETNGKITRQSLDLELSANTAKGDMIGRPRTLILWKSSLPELDIWSIRRGLLIYELWSLTSPQPMLVSSIELPLPKSMPSDKQYLIARSPGGRYLVTENAIFDTYIKPKGYGVCEFDLPEGLECTAISWDEKLFAYVCFDKYRRTLHMFDLSPGPEISLRASFTFENTQRWFLPIFSKCNPILVAAGTYILRLEDRHLIVERRLDQGILGFSDCGMYFYDLYAKPYLLPDELVPKKLPPLKKTNLHIMLIPEPSTNHYIHSHDCFQLYCKQGVLYLRRLLASDHDIVRRNRILWVLPDAMLDMVDIIYLLWPEADAENMKLVVTLDDKGPTLIDTAIKRGTLMYDEYWFEEKEWSKEEWF